jgi:hypothetical protein
VIGAVNASFHEGLLEQVARGRHEERIARGLGAFAVRRARAWHCPLKAFFAERAARNRDPLLLTPYVKNGGRA